MLLRCLVPSEGLLHGHRDTLAEGPTMAECLAANESAIRLRSDHELRQAREQTLVCASPTCPAEVHNACQPRFKARLDCRWAERSRS